MHPLTVVKWYFDTVISGRAHRHGLLRVPWVPFWVFALAWAVRGYGTLGLAASADLVLSLAREPMLLKLVSAHPGLAASIALERSWLLRLVPAFGVRALTLAFASFGLSDLSSLLLLSFSFVLLVR